MFVIFLSSLIPELTDSDRIDRIHCIPKPFFILERVQEDVLMRIPFNHVKEQLLVTSHNKGTLSSPYEHLQFFWRFIPIYHTT